MTRRLGRFSTINLGALLLGVIAMPSWATSYAVRKVPEWNVGKDKLYAGAVYRFAAAAHCETFLMWKTIDGESARTAGEIR